MRKCIRQYQSENNTYHTTYQAQNHTFRQELQHDVAVLRANSHTQTDFLGSFGNRHIHDIHNADTTNNQ